MKELIIILSSTWKFAATFPLAVLIMKMSFFETLLYTNFGGLIGVIFFVSLSKIVIKTWTKILPAQKQDKNKKIFTKRNKKLIKLKRTYGLPGIIILNPIILSIPVSAFLVAKYYGEKFINYCWLVVGQIAWSVLYTFFFTSLHDKWNLTF